MGSLVSTSNPADFANRTQTYFNPKLLEALQYNLVLAEYGQKGKFPAIGSTIRFFRPRPASTANISRQSGGVDTGSNGTLTEGTTPTNLTEVAVGYIDVPLYQRGALAKISDIVQATDLLNTVQVYTKTMGSDAALDLDTVIQRNLVTGLNDSNTTYNSPRQWYFERFGGVVNTGTSSTDFASLSAATRSNGRHTRINHLGCITTLKASKVPMINGKYVAIVPPEIMHDMRQDTTWVQGAVYDVGQLWKNGQMILDGAVFVEATNPFTESSTYKTFSSTDPGTGLIYTSFYLGENAFGVPELSNDKAGSSPYGPRLIILAQPDKSDPLNLIVTIGWKTFYGAKPLITNVSGEVPRYVQLRTKSSF